MTTRSPSGRSSATTTLLRGLAVLQGIAIIVLVVLLNGAGDPSPVRASPAAQPPRAAPAEQVQGAASPPVAPVPAPAPPTDPTPPADGAGAAAAADPMGTILYGRVVDEVGQPVTEGWISFSNPAANKQVAQVSLSTRDPCFAVAGLAPGDVTFRTRVTGYKEASGTITIPPGTAQLRHDVVLTKSWEILVRILTPDGKPLREALAAMAKERPNLFHVEVGAVATPARPERDFPLTALREITAGVGRWRGGIGFERMGRQQLPKDVAGVLELDGKQPLWISAVLRHRVLTSVPVEPGQTEAALTIGVERVLQDLATIRGRVVDAATKEPVKDARVGFGDRQSGGGGAPVDAEGRFEARDLRPGLLTLEARAGKRTATHNIVSVRPGEVLDLGDVLVAEARTISGRLEGLSGKADACRITAVSLDPPPHASLRAREGNARVEADGTFKLFVMDGRYRLRATGAGGAVMDFDTRTLGDQPLVVQLAKEAQLRLDVQSNGEPFELAVFDAGGRELMRRDLQHGWKFPLWFLPGDYRLELKDGSGKVDTRRITLGEAGADLRVP